MIDKMYLYGAIALMLIIIGRDLLKKYYKIDMDKIDVEVYKDKLLKKLNLQQFIKEKPSQKKSAEQEAVIQKNSGTKSLVMLDAGTNKATVMATLRQITGIDYVSAKKVVENIPNTFMTNISDKEADLTKKALEFVGAKIEIRQNK